LQEAQSCAAHAGDRATLVLDNAGQHGPRWQAVLPVPNMQWVSDLTYVATLRGFVCVAFIIDAYLRHPNAQHPVPETNSIDVSTQ
jgi:transposase InsO family protein